MTCNHIVQEIYKNTQMKNIVENKSCISSMKTIKRQQAKLYQMRCSRIKRDSLHLSFCLFASSLVVIISNYDEISHLRVYRVCYYRAYVCCACLFNQVKLMINILILYSIALKRLKEKKLLKLFIK